MEIEHFGDQSEFADISYFCQPSNRLVTSILLGLPFLCC